MISRVGSPESSRDECESGSLWAKTAGYPGKKRCATSAPPLATAGPISGKIDGSAAPLNPFATSEIRYSRSRNLVAAGLRLAEILPGTENDRIEIEYFARIYVVANRSSSWKSRPRCFSPWKLAPPAANLRN